MKALLSLLVFVSLMTSCSSDANTRTDFHPDIPYHRRRSRPHRCSCVVNLLARATAEIAA
jgi:hypothetical protein